MSGGIITSVVGGYGSGFLCRNLYCGTGFRGGNGRLVVELFLLWGGSGSGLMAYVGDGNGFLLWNLHCETYGFCGRIFILAKFLGLFLWQNFSFGITFGTLIPLHFSFG